MNEDPKTGYRDQFKEAVVHFLRNHGPDRLYFVMGFAEFDPLSTQATIMENYNIEKQELDIKVVVDALLEDLKRILKLQDLKIALSKKTSIEENNNELNSVNVADSLFKMRVIEIAAFLNNFVQDLSTVEDYRSTLLSKRRQMTNVTKWGDTDSSAWVQCMNEFAEDKLLCGQFNEVFSKLPGIVGRHLRSVFTQPLFIYLIAYGISDRSSDTLFPRISEHGASNQEDSISIESGIDFENFLFSHIRKNFPHISIELTPATGDQGADLVVSTTKSKIVIQAKYYAGKVGNVAVQQVVAAKSYYDADASMVVTNSIYTQSAISLALKTNTILCTVDDVISQLRTFN